MQVMQVLLQELHDATRPSRADYTVDHLGNVSQASCQQSALSRRWTALVRRHTLVGEFFDRIRAL
jgi:hypothetical protein